MCAKYFSFEEHCVAEAYFLKLTGGIVRSSLIKLLRLGFNVDGSDLIRKKKYSRCNSTIWLYDRVMAANMLLASGASHVDTLNYCFLRPGLQSGRTTSKHLPTKACRKAGSLIVAQARGINDDHNSPSFSKMKRLSQPPEEVVQLQKPAIRRVAADDLKSHAVSGLLNGGVLDFDRIPDDILPEALVVSDVIGAPKIQPRPDWWPDSGTNYIDLDIHDLPHEKATLEWWYVNSHLSTKDGRQFSIFASFFRLAEKDKRTGEILKHCHSMTCGVTDVRKKSYTYQTLVDPCTPKTALEMLESSKGMDPLLRRALIEVYSKGSVPLPDILLDEDAFVSNSRLELDYDGNRFEKTSDGRYRLIVLSKDENTGAELTFDPRTPPIRHGDGGVVSAGRKDEGMFYYFMPNCKVEGKILVDGKMERVEEAIGWYDHEFGRPGSGSTLHEGNAWNWLSAQLSNGYQITAYNLFDSNDTTVPTGTCVVVVDPAGESRTYNDFVLQPVEDATWTSLRTFVEYPLAWELRIPGANISLRGEAFEVPAQEYVTSLSDPAFWEGRINISGAFSDGEWVSGLGYAERAGFQKIQSLKDFFKAVTKETLKAVHTLLPLPVTETDLVRLMGMPSRPHWISGVECEQFASSIIKPIRDVIDRSGKCWRSYASIASMDIIGNILNHSPEHLAYAELMHVGSLIIDDVQDNSTIRRGHPTCHQIHGEPLAINAGTICYFLAQLAGKTSMAEVTDRNKVENFEMFFDTMRAAHAGQALDIHGFESAMPEVIVKGAQAAKELEKRVLTVHLLKSGAPCSSLGSVGAQRGGGTPEQVEAVGDFYEAIGVAFQIVDDVLNLRGFEGNLKQKGEDIACGKITLPIAKAMSMLPDQASRQSLWDIIRSKPTDPAVIASAIEQLEECGALQACADQASDVVESAWQKLDPLVPDSYTKIIVRAFGWYVLHRYY